MTCPICNRYYCDHSPFERGQSEEEMMTDMNNDHKKIVAQNRLEELAAYHYPTYEHSLRVGQYVRKVVEKIGEYEPLSMLDVEQMGQLHDIGKLKLDCSFLWLKSVTPQQYTEIKRHTREGYELLKEQLPIAACAAGKHHPSYAVPEYPCGLNMLQRDAIDRVMPYVTLCDFYDALMSRDTDAFAHIDKKDLKQVQGLLEERFPCQSDGIGILLDK